MVISRNLLYGKVQGISTNMRALQRLDKIISEKYPLLSRSQCKEALELGLVTSLEGKNLKKGDYIREESQIHWHGLDKQLKLMRSGNPIEGVSPVHEEQDFCIVDKPAGVLGHPLHLLDVKTLSQWAFHHYPASKLEFLEPVPVLVPHRLDIGTSGLQLICLKKHSYQMWRKKFQNKLVSKEYLAWVWGVPDLDQFSCHLPIGQAKGEYGKVTTESQKLNTEKRLYDAKTNFEVLNRNSKKGMSLILARMSTGMTHQVRVHLAALGFPLVGDPSYDKQYALRDLKPTYHQLRAVRISTEDLDISVSDSSFRALYEQ